MARKEIGAHEANQSYLNRIIAEKDARNQDLHEMMVETESELLKLRSYMERVLHVSATIKDHDERHDRRTRGYQDPDAADESSTPYGMGDDEKTHVRYNSAVAVAENFVTEGISMRDIMYAKMGKLIDGSDLGGAGRSRDADVYAVVDVTPTICRKGCVRLSTMAASSTPRPR